MTGKEFRRILIVGGGSKNRLLCQATANASGLPVVSFALEGTAAAPCEALAKRGRQRGTGAHASPASSSPSAP